MAYAPRPTTIFPASTASARQTSGTHSSTSQPSSALAARIAAKRSELENLKQLRDLSGALAGQMGVLEEKLATLRDGTEAVACVLANWDNVLRAISMASMKVPRPAATAAAAATATGGEVEHEQPAQGNGEEAQLPVTLVRIPAHSRDPRQRILEGDGASS